jgi:hypothetical protein
MTMTALAARHPMFATLALRNGVRVDLVADRHRYITNEENRAVIGPVRHRRTWGWKRRGQKAATGQLAAPQERLMTSADMDTDIVKAVASIADGFARVQLGDQLRMVMPPQPSPPQDTRGRWRKMADWWLDRFYNEEWHRGMRNCAIDLVMWGFAVAAVVTFGKGLLWVLSV